MKICFNTGAFKKWKIAEDSDNLIAFIQEYDFDGGELTFATAKEMMNFNPSDKNKQYLRGLDYLSLHLPFKHTYKRDLETKGLVKKANDIIDDLDINHTVIHHTNIKDQYFLNQIKIPKSIENLSKRCRVPIEDYGNFIDKSPDYGIVFDTTHALSCSKAYSQEFIDRYSEKIAEVHLSEYKDGIRHLPIYHDYNSLIPLVSKLNVPIILEMFYDKDDYISFQKDREFLGIKRI